VVIGSPLLGYGYVLLARSSNLKVVDPWVAAAGIGLHTLGMYVTRIPTVGAFGPSPSRIKPLVTATALPIPSDLVSVIC
jgi:hypothetical protein